MKSSLRKIRTTFGVSEYALKNGLHVLYRHERSAPVVAVCVTYHVGSRNEAQGHTGSTHILEHLLFKDSANFRKENGKEFATYIEWLGAQWNATTWFDRTNYFELVPAEYVEEALSGEADRMRNSLFSTNDLASEMTVVRNEYERGRNNPFELIDEEIMAAVYSKHPYRIPTIGTKEDIEGSTVGKLREFYNTFYWPNNATLMVVGNVPWGRANKLIEKYFGGIPASPHTIPELKVVEPKQTKPRSVSLKKQMGVSIASLYYKTPPARHKNFPALLVIASALGGGFSSRLDKALVNTGKATEVSAHAMALYDPGVFMLTAQAASAKPPKLLAAMRKEVETFAKPEEKGGFSKEELERVVERLLSEFSAERDGPLSEVRSVSEALAAGDWTLFYRLEKEIQTLTPAQVRAVAKNYLSRSNETSGILQP